MADGTLARQPETSRWKTKESEQSEIRDAVLQKLAQFVSIWQGCGNDLIHVTFVSFSSKHDTFGWTHTKACLNQLTRELIGAEKTSHKYKN